MLTKSEEEILQDFLYEKRELTYEFHREKLIDLFKRGGWKVIFYNELLISKEKADYHFLGHHMRLGNTPPTTFLYYLPRGGRILATKK
ncbi:MAG: hypothetical protein HOG08_03510 [Candidatus Magasanikbacteria bacterium]|nr:hypothetical protein [Candidatus Magasanikbacteria bacterium]